MKNEIQKAPTLTPDVVEKLVIKGDLSGLNQQEKVAYYNLICDRVGVDPAMQPFKLLNLQGKHVLYLDRSGAQQLNKLHNVSHQITSRETVTDAGVYQVTARATLPDGRYTESIGAVNIAGLKGDAYANAIMKAETKAKRRATLDLLGLGMLDETEAETIPNAQPMPAPAAVVQADIIKQYEHRSSDWERRVDDPEELWQLISEATNPTSLKLLYKYNQAFIKTNPEYQQFLNERGQILTAQAQTQLAL